MSSLYGADVFVPGLGDGHPGTFALVGSGCSVPAGIEAVLEYNGIWMNVQANLDRYRIVGLDGLADADIRDARDVNTDEDGETVYNAFYGGRTIVITGEILAHNAPKMRDMSQALRQAFADITQEKPLYFRLGDFSRDHYIMCKKISPIAMTETQPDRRFARQFQVTLRASNPRFVSFYEKMLIASPPVGLITSPFTAINAGNYWAEPVWRIYGPSASSQFTNETTGESFTVVGVPSHDYFEYDLSANSKRLQNSLGDNMWDRLSDDSDYMRLASGDNPITYIGDSPRIQLSWRDSWI